eukprot:11324793-Alexandrium_andersonii.AAC.1
MSASLVGSEMCIRDRSCFEWTVAAGGRTRGVACLAACRAQCHFQEGSVPVSYTHLTLPTICSV